MLTIVAGVIGTQEILFIAVVVLILFGGKKIPELMKGLGKGMKEYKKAVNGIKEQINDIEKDINSDLTAGEEQPKHTEEKHRQETKNVINEDKN